MDAPRLHGTIRFADLTYVDAEAVATGPRTPVLLLPVGSTEPHGPHAPLSTDPIISMGMCLRAARQLIDDADVRVLVLPALDYGVTRVSRSFRGAVGIREETLQALLVDVCTSLAEQGFRRVVWVNNHFEPAHVRTLHAAIDVLQREHGLAIGYLDLTRRERAARLSEEFRRAECHAGRYETSLVLADHPLLVDEERMSTLPYMPVDMAAEHAAGKHEFRAMGMPEAYCGAPAEATAAEGESLYATLTEMLIEIIRAVARGSGGRDAAGLYTRV
jgi:creatinine amidohydrolase